MPLVTRLGVSARLKRAFIGNADQTLASTKAIAKTIDTLVTWQGNTFGGNCNYYDRDCHDLTVTSSTSIAQLDNVLSQRRIAPMSPAVSTTRRGLLARVCHEVADDPVAVTNALNVAALSINSPATDTNVIRAYRIFYPLDTPSAAVIAALKQVHAQALSRSYGNTVAWGFVITAVCDASGGDTL